MKYKDYYAALGVKCNASDDEIKKAYRRLARKFHPDVSKEKDAEEKFKEMAEAYQTLSDKEKRAAYDDLGSHRPGEDIRPPPGWETHFRQGDAGGADLGGIDLGDLFEMLGRGRGNTPGRGRHTGDPTVARRGQDLDATTALSLEDAARGAELSFDFSMPEMSTDGSVRHVKRTTRIRVPKGATDGQRLRVPGKGSAGINGAPPGDLYLNITLRPHKLFRPNGHDLYLELPIAPWEAVLGANVEVPTLDGRVALTIPSGSRAGQKLRIGGKGMPRPNGSAGDLYCLLTIAVPDAPGEHERALYQDLAKASPFNPREHLS